jgi:hypothetical protein
MKSQFLAFTIVLGVLFPGFVLAQSVQPGAKIGLNLANFYGEDTDGDINVGLLFGGLLHIPVSDQFAFQPELLFSQQGTQGKEDGITVRFNNNYLMIPLMGKICLAPNFALEVGPQLGFLLSARLTGGENGNDVSVNMKELYKTVDFGLNAGLSYESESNFIVTTRYGLGLTNIVDSTIDDVNSKNSVFQISLGYRFLLNDE